MEIKNIVSTEKMAKDLSAIYISSIYGWDVAQRQKPYSAVEINDVWIVKGVLSKLLLGGVFEINISKMDGRILSLSHSR